MKKRLLTLACIAAMTVAAAVPAGAADLVIRPELASPPTFTLDVPTPPRYEVTIRLLDPRAHGSRLSRASAVWGDGTSTTKTLDPLTLYTSIALTHRYTAKPSTVQYPIAVRLSDQRGQVKTKSTVVTVRPLFDVTLYPVRFTSVIDCDTWSGDTEYDVAWRKVGTRDHRTLTKSFSLGQGEHTYIMDEGIHASNVRTGAYPTVLWDWRENDFGLDPPLPADYPSRLVIPVNPVPGDKKYEDYDTQDGCSVRVNWKIRTWLMPA